MLLNMHIIAESLEDACTSRHIASPPSDMTITHAELYDPALELLEDVVYLVDEDPAALATLMEFPLHLHVLYRGKPTDAIPAAERQGPVSWKGSQAASVSPSTCARRTGSIDIAWVEAPSLALLLSRVQRIFRRYELWDEDLKRIMLRNGTVTDFLVASMSVFRSNILVHDRDMKTIAYKTHAGRRANNPLDTLKQDKLLTRDVLNTFKKSVRLNSMDVDPFTIKGPHFWTSANGPQSLNMNVFHNGNCIARMVLTTRSYESEPTTKDVGPFMLLGTYIEATLVASFTHLLNHDTDTFTSLLSDILNGKTVKKAQFKEGAQRIKWDHWNDEFLLLSVETDEEKTHHLSSAYPLISIFSRVSEMVPESHTFTYEGRGMVLLNLSRSKVKLETLYSILNHIATENGCLFGACRPFTGLKHLKRAHCEAIDALDCLPTEARESDECRIVRISDVALPLATKCVAERISPVTFCPNGLRELIHYDNAHRSELYPTVRAYIESNCSPTKSAKALFVQRSTFLYRFKKAQEFLDFDVDDPETQLRLRLAFKLLDTLPEQEFSEI